MPWAILHLTIINPVKLDPKLIALTIAFVAITACDAAFGDFRGNNPADILGELRPLSYFPMVLFFAVAIRTATDVELIARFLVVCGIALSVAYLLLLLAAYSGLVSYLDIYNLLSQSDEFIFRQAVDRQLVFVGFLYKGAIYVGVAVLLLMFGQFRYGQWLAAVCMIALAMTLTRSLLVGLACSLLFGMLLARSWRRSIVALGLLGIMAAIAIVALRTETGMNRRELAGHFAATKPPDSVAAPSAPIIESRPTDSLRTSDLIFVVNHLNAKSFLIGNGLGAPIGSRDRIELNYLKVLYKQGLIGLAFWGLLAGYIFWLYWLATRRTRQLSLPFLLSAVFVYATTTFNTILTGSIGLGAVFISIGSLYALSRSDPEQQRMVR